MNQYQWHLKKSYLAAFLPFPHSLENGIMYFSFLKTEYTSSKKAIYLILSCFSQCCTFISSELIKNIHQFGKRQHSENILEISKNVEKMYKASVLMLKVIFLHSSSFFNIPVKTMLLHLCYYSTGKFHLYTNSLPIKVLVSTAG